MRVFLSPLLASGAAVALLLAPLWSRLALADHGGPLRTAPMSPVLVGVLAGALALAAGLIVVVIATLLRKKAPPSE
jgi:hypothetical protein